MLFRRKLIDLKGYNPIPVRFWLKKNNSIVASEIGPELKS